MTKNWSNLLTKIVVNVENPTRSRAWLRTFSKKVLGSFKFVLDEPKTPKLIIGNQFRKQNATGSEFDFLSRFDLPLTAQASQETP